MKEQKQIFKELLILVAITLLGMLVTASLVYAYSIPKRIDEIHQSLEAINQDVEQVEKDLNEVKFEKSLNKTCQLEVVECEFE